MINNELFANTLKILKEEKKHSSLRDILETMNPVDIAELLSRLPEEHLPLLFRLLTKEKAAEVFVEMDEKNQELLIRGFSDNELKEIMDVLRADDAADLVDEMPANVVTRILHQAAPDKRKTINELLRYPEDTAGSIMTVDFVELRPDVDSERAISYIRQNGTSKKTVDSCYVTDNGRRLLGTVSLRDLIMDRENRPVTELMDTNVVFANTHTDQEEVAQLLAKYRLSAIPITDGENRLVGLVTVDEALDVLEQEATEDIEKMAAISPSEKPYMKTSVFALWKNRIPWLLLLMVSATVTGMIITRFENALSVCVVLAAYIPMLMDTGGNSGSQASVTIIRALSLGQLQFADVFRVIWKEARVSFLCGATLSVVNFGKLLLLDHIGAITAAVVCLTLFFTVVAAKLVGCTLPMLAKRIGFDPAVMASPFITTIVDAISLLIYFRFAVALLGL